MPPDFELQHYWIYSNFHKKIHHSFVVWVFYYQHRIIYLNWIHYFWFYTSVNNLHCVFLLFESETNCGGWDFKNSIYMILVLRTFVSFSFITSVKIHTKMVRRNILAYFVQISWFFGEWSLKYNNVRTFPISRVTSFIRSIEIFNG